MKYCEMCGASIPDGQNTCSMCYGDIDYGKDNYYRDLESSYNKSLEDDYNKSMEEYLIEQERDDE